MSRLEAVYRQSQRWRELATLLERRLRGLMERCRRRRRGELRALELADVYERSATLRGDRRLDARGREYPEHAPAFANLARLYEAVGQWSKVIESLTRELDVHDAEAARAAAAASASGRARFGGASAQIFEKELELPERAIEAYGAVLRRRSRRRPKRRRRSSGCTRSSGAGRISRRCSAARRARRIATTQARSCSSGARRCMTDRIGDRRAARRRCCGSCARCAPRTTRIAARLERALGRAGQRRRAGRGVAHAHPRRAKRGGATKPELARMHVELGALEAQLGERRRRERTLEQALELVPDDPRALAELAQAARRAAPTGTATRRRASARPRWRRTRSRRCARSSTRRACTWSGARTTPAAKRALERALQKDPDAAGGGGALRIAGAPAAATTRPPTSWRSRSSARRRRRRRSGRRSCTRGSARRLLRRGEPDEAARRVPRGGGGAARLSAGDRRGSPIWRRSRARGTRSRRSCATRRRATACRRRWRRSSTAGWRMPPSSRGASTTPIRRCSRPIG